MKNTERRKQELHKMRVRKLIFWGRVNGDFMDDAVLKALIAKGIWRDTGMRLADWLVNEVGVEFEKAIDLTFAAIEEGLEDESLYK